MVGFSSLTLALSVEDAVREGGGGLCGFMDSLCFGDCWPFEDVAELVLTSDLIASFVENIRVRRLVIEGFSVGADDLCGSEGGAVSPLLFRFSVEGIAAMLGFVGRISGDPTIEEFCDCGGECLRPSWPSLGVLTLAMLPVVVFESCLQQRSGLGFEIGRQSGADVARSLLLEIEGVDVIAQSRREAVLERKMECKEE